MTHDETIVATGKFSGMEDRLAEASSLLKSMASQTRLMILCTLAEGEMSVSDLAAVLAVQQSTVSQNLSRLRLERLVKSRRDAQTVYYSLEEGPAQAIMGVLYAHFCRQDD